jgi:phospholipase/lecithinase/hemolysin
MAGQWDIIELYKAVNVTHTMTQASAEAELKNRAATLANVVKDIISTGAKVVLGLTPDLGQSPMALSGNQASLQALTKVFNDTLYITNLGNQSGRNLAGVNPEPFTEPSVRSAAYYYDAGACDPAKSMHPGDPNGTPVASDPDPDKAGQAVMFCTGDTLVSGVTTLVYMWADDTHFSPSGHNLIGSAGFNRAYNQF